MKEKLIKLSSSLESNFFYDYDMSKATWFKAGGKAKALIVVKNEKELEIIMQSINQFRHHLIAYILIRIHRHLIFQNLSNAPKGHQFLQHSGVKGSTEPLSYPCSRRS